MLTPFGKEVRKQRMEANISLKSMADGIGVSSAYLSAVEAGRKELNGSLVSKVCGYLGASPEVEAKLKESAEASKSKFKFDMSNQSGIARDTVAVFARTMSSLPENELARLKKTLEEFQ